MSISAKNMKKGKRPSNSKSPKGSKPVKAEAPVKKPDIAIAATEKSRKAVIDSIQARLEGKTPPTSPKAAKTNAGGAKAPKVVAASTAGPKAKRSRLSAIDAAAQLLAKAGKPMRAQDLVEAMATSGLWKSPGGKTPAATLSAAIGREIKTLGTKARFKKADRGLFASIPANNSSKGA
ncbi:MAG: winged helix-turn-helix domain-containing protein [Fimbriimonadaceae bacterium]|nr:winged helix-turn-helix domain-containing protein [Fimbriimonadaceae bacterium]